jgi:hypothetical protein
MHEPSFALRIRERAHLWHSLLKLARWGRSVLDVVLVVENSDSFIGSAKAPSGGRIV